MIDVKIPTGIGEVAAERVGVLDHSTALQVEIPVQQGGQVLLSATVVGASVLTWMVVFRY